MATEFIGSIVTVTLNQPPNAQARGLVEGITEGKCLDLKGGKPLPIQLCLALH